VAARLVELALGEPVGRAPDMAGPQVTSWTDLLRAYLMATRRRRWVCPVLIPGTRAVRRGETEIGLTAREFAMLEYLIRRSGQVVPKSELLDHVWEASDSADLNVVEVYAGYLRRKIDVPFGRAALQTLRGAGYRLAADGG